MNRASSLWALPVGVLSVAAQIIIFYARFGRWNTDASLTDYGLMFLAGSFGGAILVFFLNRQTSTAQRQVVFIAFLLASPIALLLMVLGGLVGWIGVLVYPQIAWAVFMWIGAWAGKLLARSS